MREETVSFGGKDIRLKEKRIGELEELVLELFPDSGGNLSNIEAGELLEHIGFDMLYEKIPILIPEVSADDVRNAYLSELESLLGAFIDINFYGVKQLMGSLMSILPNMVPPGQLPK